MSSSRVSIRIFLRSKSLIKNCCQKLLISSIFDKILRFLCKQRFHYSVHKSSSVVTIMGQTIPFHCSVRKSSSLVTILGQTIPFHYSVHKSSSLVTILGQTIPFHYSVRKSSSLVTILVQTIPFHYSVRKSSSLVTILGQTIPFHTIAAAPLSICLSFWSCDSCRHLPEPKHHSFLFNH